MEGVEGIEWGEKVKWGDRVEGIEWGGRGAVIKLLLYAKSTITVILGRLEGVQWEGKK